MAVVTCSITDSADATFTSVGVSITTPVISWADATGALVLAVIVGSFSSSGDASSSITAQDRINYQVSHANATGTPNVAMVETLSLTDFADAHSFIFAPSITHSEQSTANATATLTGDAAANIVSTANATAAPNYTLTVNITDHAAAQSLVTQAALLYTFTSTGNATSALALSNHETVSITDTANATSALTPAFHTAIELLSTANAVATPTTQLVATLNFRSRATAYGTVTDPIDALSRSALWMNTESTAGAHFPSYAFNSFAMHGGYALGAGDAGVYLLEGGDDAGVAIVADVRTDLLDFDSAQKKRLDGMLIAGTSDAPIRVTVTDEQGTFTYDTHLASAATQRNNRAQLGRGLTATYFRFGFSNPAGDDFGVDEVKCEVGESKRRR